MTYAYAIVDRGAAIINTISDTPRAAKVNWLVVERGIVVRKYATDRSIENAWQNEKGSAECRRVKIEVAQDA